MPPAEKQLMNQMHSAQLETEHQRYSVTSNDFDNMDDDIDDDNVGEQVAQEPIFQQATFVTFEHRNGFNKNSDRKTRQHLDAQDNTNGTSTPHGIDHVNQREDIVSSNDENVAGKKEINYHNNHNNDDEDEDEDNNDLPANLHYSYSNIPGLTPSQLLAEHRRSIAEAAHKPEESMDFHSLTLSRHQISPHLSLRELQSQDDSDHVNDDDHEQEEYKDDEEFKEDDSIKVHGEYIDAFRNYQFGDRSESSNNNSNKNNNENYLNDELDNSYDIMNDNSNDNKLANDETNCESIDT